MKKKKKVENTDQLQVNSRKTIKEPKNLPKIITAIMFILIITIFIKYISSLSLDCQKLMFVVEKMHLKTWQYLLKDYDYVPSFIQSFRDPKCVSEIVSPPLSPPPQFPKSDWDIIHLPTIFYIWKIFCKNVEALKFIYITQGIASMFFAYLIIFHITKSSATSVLSLLFISKYFAQSHILMLELWAVLPVFISIYFFVRGKYLCSVIFAMIAFLFKETTGVILLSGTLSLIIDDFMKNALRNRTICWLIALAISIAIILAFDYFIGGNAIRNVYLKGFHPIMFFNQYLWFNDFLKWIVNSLHLFINIQEGLLTKVRGREGIFTFGTLICLLSIWGIFKNQLMEKKVKVFLALSILTTPLLGMTIGDYSNPIVYTERGRIAHISLPLQIIFFPLGLSLIIKRLKVTATADPIVKQATPKKDRVYL